MQNLTIKTPAKINIGLNVVGQRPDGFHNIETVFYPIKLYDEITISSGDKFAFECKGNTQIDKEDNTVVKAVGLLEKECGIKFNISINLKKNIPAGAGMGGGSSDGAAVLNALNKMFDLNLKLKHISELALNLGSDVPFFLNPVPSFAVSRGEKLRPIKLKVHSPILIVNPGIHISTKWAYENMLYQNNHTNLLNLMDHETVDWDVLKRKVSNDFEDVVFDKYEEVKKVKELLYDFGASIALMTGSGSTIFGIFSDNNSAENAQKRLPSHYFTFINKA